MTFGADTSRGGRITTIAESNKIFDHFSNAGHNELDTARVYCGGTQESFTAQTNWGANGFQIATKWYPQAPGDLKAAKLREMLLKSLQELNVGKVDIFYLHAPDRSVPFAETLEECDKLFREGKFAKLGLSNFAAFEVAEIVTLCRAKGWVQPTVYQGKYNAIRTLAFSLPW